MTRCRPGFKLVRVPAQVDTRTTKHEHGPPSSIHDLVLPHKVSLVQSVGQPDEEDEG